MDYRQAPPSAACRDLPARGPHERVVWQRDSDSGGAVLLDQASRDASPTLARLAHPVSMASSLAASKVDCE